MKDITFEAQLIAANPHTKQTNSFVNTTMEKIVASQKSHSFTSWLSHLHKPALAALALVVIAIIGGAVYAAVQFAPALIEILSKDTNPRGAAEYSVAGFEQCSSDGRPATDRFEVNSDAPALNDEEVKKILQARCELQWTEGFVKNTWSTYGTNAEWKDGDTIFYTRVDLLGKVQSANESDATVEFGLNTDQISHLSTLPGEKLKAYLGGKEVSLDEVKPGDTVFTIVRISETYHDRSRFNQNKNTTTPQPPNNMQVTGLVALAKLSLPMEYYGFMQNYLIEIPKCIGNEEELCPSTSSVDVYPRAGGEGATNPNKTNSPDSVYSQISGTVTELYGDRLTLKSRSDKLYTITLGEDGFSDYNNIYTKAYTNMDVTLKVGSNVMAMYDQPKEADATSITKEQVIRVSLLVESLNPKKGDLKQY